MIVFLYFTDNALSSSLHSIKTRQSTIRQ